MPVARTSACQDIDSGKLSQSYVVVLLTPAGTGTHLAFCTKASTIRAAAAWPDTLWDGGPFTTSYTEFWMDKMAGDRAEQRVPDFAAWRPNGSKEFLDWLRRDQAARREAAQRHEAVPRVQQAARTASSYSGKRDWVDKLLRGQSAATFPGMAGDYKEQWNHIRDGYGGLPNMPSW